MLKQRYFDMSKLLTALESVPEATDDELTADWFSEMGKDVLRLLRAYPQLSSLYSTFSSAHEHIQPSLKNKGACLYMREVSAQLAVALRELNITKPLPVCMLPTIYALRTVCDHVLLPDSSCDCTWHEDFSFCT